MELEKDLATIYKAGGKVECKFPGLIYQVLKVSSKITEFHVQIFHCTNLRQQFYPNNPAFYEIIPVIMRVTNPLPQFCACHHPWLQPGGWALVYRECILVQINAQIKNI